MDGSDIRLLANTSLNFVNGLTIDYENDKLYWVDASHDVIETSSLTGEDRQKVNVKGN